VAPSGARPDRGQGTTRAHRLKYHPRNLPSVHRHVLCNLLRPTATNLRRVELCLISPHRIENSRETTRERNGGHVIAASVRDALRPSPQEEGFGFRLASEHAPGSFDQEPPHAGVTGFRNGPFSLRFARAPLTRHEPQITFELMRVSEPSYTRSIVATNAMAVTGPTPGTVMSRRARSSSRAATVTCLSKSSIQVLSGTKSARTGVS